jgi:hypothetical protein
MRRGALAAALLATAVPAARAQARLELVPGLSVSQAYDDNVFSRPGGTRDLITRVSPQLTARCTSSRLEARARYGLDMERFQENPELSTPVARQEAGVDARWRASRRATLTLGGAYARTATPGELNDLTGITLQRAPARRLRADASLALALGARTSATIEQGFTHEAIEGGAVDDVFTSGVALQRRLGPRATAGLAYRLRRFSFAGEATLSQALTLRWTRTASRTGRLELEAGPRLSAGQPGIEMSAGWRQRVGQDELALSVLQTEVAVLGRRGPVTTAGAAAAWTHRLAAPLTLAVGPSLFRTRDEDLRITVFRLNVDVSWRVTSAVSLVGGHQLAVQSGGFAPGADELRRNASLVSLVLGR